jgi:hypothetical protein
VFKERKDRKVFKAQSALRDHPEPMVHKARKEQLVHKVYKELLVPKEHRVQ